MYNVYDDSCLLVGARAVKCFRGEGPSHIQLLNFTIITTAKEKDLMKSSLKSVSLSLHHFFPKTF